MPSANYQDFELILDRVIWSLKLTPKERMAHIRENPMDAFHKIPDPRNGSFLVVGEEVTKLLRKIAKRHLDSNPDRKARTKVSPFVEQLTKKFSEFFLQQDQKRAFDEANVSRWIASAYRATAKEYDATIHYIPCAFVFSENVGVLEIGPVTLYSKLEFSHLYGSEIEGLRESIARRHQQAVREAVDDGLAIERASTPAQSCEFGNELVNELQEFYSGFSWFAAVEVSASQDEVSYDRASMLVRGALDVIKLTLGPEYTDRLRTVNDLTSFSSSAFLSRDSSGELSVRTSHRLVDNVVGEESLEYLEAGSCPYFKTLTQVLGTFSDFGEAPPLCVRFMDALYWFGEAVVEKSHAARLVKFVTAIERVCGTGEERDDEGKLLRGVTDIITSRASIFYSVLEGLPFDDAKKEVRTIYDWRSSLVHGSTSPFDDSLAAKSNRVSSVTRTILLAAIDYYRRIGLHDQAMNNKRLKAAFIKLESWNEEGRPTE